MEAFQLFTIAFLFAKYSATTNQTALPPIITTSLPSQLLNLYISLINEEIEYTIPFFLSMFSNKLLIGGNNGKTRAFLNELCIAHNKI